MQILTRIACRLFPNIHLMWLVEETKKNLPKELDFRVEAENADRLHKMYSHLPYLKVSLSSTNIFL